MKDTYSVFGGKKLIRIPEDVKIDYEEKVGTFTNNTANYFVEVLDLSEDMSEQMLSEQIVRAMKEDCSDSALVKSLLQGGGNIGR